MPNNDHDAQKPELIDQCQRCFHLLQHHDPVTSACCFDDDCDCGHFVGDVIIPPDAPEPERQMRPGIDRVRMAVAGSKTAPTDMLAFTYCVLHDLIELLVRQGVIKLSDLDKIKKHTMQDFLASRIGVDQ